jgi:hypothetical protein
VAELMLYTLKVNLNKAEKSLAIFQFDKQIAHAAPKKKRPLPEGRRRILVPDGLLLKSLSNQFNDQVLKLAISFLKAIIRVHTQSGLAAGGVPGLIVCRLRHHQCPYQRAIPISQQKMG